VIKPEPYDSGDSTHSPQPHRSHENSSSVFQFSSSSKTNNETLPKGETIPSSYRSTDSPQTPTITTACVKSEPTTMPPTIFFPQYPLPLGQALPSSPIHYLTPTSPGIESGSFRLVLPSPTSDNSLSKKKEESLASSNLVKKEKEQKQSFKCQKCGKCYNWNYNLNRHMRFECGIENRFECSMCQKRFPYKQNVAIHLKRKHKLQLDNADEMISLGHITLLPGKNENPQPQNPQ